jgi:membrane-bound serine protease (ClpP class)
VVRFASFTARPPAAGRLWHALALAIACGLTTFGWPAQWASAAAPLAASESPANDDPAAAADELPVDEPPAEVNQVPANVDAGDSESKPGARPDRPAAKPDDPNPVRPAGRLIRVSLPLSGAGDAEVKRAVERALVELPRDAGRPVVVFELLPTRSKFGEGTEFGRALDLARYLSSRDLSAIKTVAYIPQSIKGHGVLVALACEEIVMAPDAEIGDAGIDEPAAEAIDPTVLSGYSQIADRRRTIPSAVAIGMLDRQAQVLKVETEASTEFVLSRDLPELKSRHTIQSEQVLIPAGQLGVFSGRTARELGFVKYLAADPGALAKALGLPPAAVEDDPSRGGQWHAVRVPLQGPITPLVAQQTARIIENLLRDDSVNFICLWIESPGGPLADSVSLANTLADLDPGRVRTVAYVATEAAGGAALVAMACDQLVMQRDAALGGSGLDIPPNDELDQVRQIVREQLAKRKARSWSLMAALVDSRVRVFRYTHSTTGLVEYFSPEEAEDLPDADQWVKGEEIARTREPLRLSAQRAGELGVARHTVADFGELKQLYNLEGDIVIARPGWADALIDALAAPGVALLLLFIGIAALYAELHAPGIGVGGFITGLCFLLFFWSKYLDGTAGWLEVLLFGAGLVSVLLEIFVFPGTAIFGLGGGLLIITSLVLASQTFVLPHNDYQFRQLRDTLVGLSAVGVGVIVAALVMRRFLPKTALFGHMVLEPPSSSEIEHIHNREAMVDFSHLLGGTGVTTTPLAPAGKARFGDQLVACASRGEFIDRGVTVTVIEIHGNRIVVRPTA